MKNIINIYDPCTESKNTIQTMINNFSHGYDGDPTEEQILLFENRRKKMIKQKYIKSFEQRSIEEKTREIISSDLEIQKVLSEAGQYHKGQYRKFNHTPYIKHPVAVAKIISRNFLEKDIIEAGLLHDVIEDVPNGREIIKSYSDTIYTLVDSVTEQDKSLSWKDRKLAYIKHIETYDYKSIAISLSDRIQNLRDMINLLEKYGNKIWNKFHAGPEDQKRFLLSYSMNIKKQIDKTEDENINKKLLNLYNELSTLIGYFIELLNKANKN